MGERDCSHMHATFSMSSVCSVYRKKNQIGTVNDMNHIRLKFAHIMLYDVIDIDHD